MPELNGTTGGLAKLADGASSEVYALRDQRVVKLFKPGFRREAIELELHHSRLAHGLGIPTPRAEGLVTLQGRTGIVFERCDGPTLYDLIVQRAQPAAVLANLFFEVQRAIHESACPALDPLAARLARRVLQAHDVPEGVRRMALAALAAAPDADTLCHGDFHPINVIVTGERAVVIDWFDAARGDPALDVVRTLLYLQHARPDATDPAFRAAFLHAYVKRCRQAWPGRIEALQRWGLPVAVARLAEPLGDAERAALHAFVASLAPGSPAAA